MQNLQFRGLPFPYLFFFLREHPALPLPSHWPELDHVTNPSYKGWWEDKYLVERNEVPISLYPLVLY